MNRKMIANVVWMIMILLLAACGGPSQEYETGERLLTESFDEASAWETYLDDGIALQVVDGAYRVQTGDEGYIWGLNDASHNDVILEVTANQLSAHKNNAYGVMCRSDTSNNGDGYYFFVSGDGFYAISRGEGDEVTPIVEWTESSAINTGATSNKLRAVCIGDYLALYVNDKFVAEVNDTMFSNGYAGFAARTFEGGDIAVTFDDLTIWQASKAK